jgi:hypothetical protein
MRSAVEHPEVVQKYLEAEKAARRVMGPFAVGEIKAYISSLGVIPKKHKPGSWRLILDLSHPEGFSVNDGIRREECSLTYLKLDEVALTILRLRRGGLMAKRYIGHVLGRRSVLNVTLSFGLLSVPKFFTARADGVCWV